MTLIACVKIQGLNDGDRPSVVSESHVDAGGTRGCCFDLQFRIHMRDFPADVVLADCEVCDADLVPGFEPNRPPNAAGYKRRAPVPSILIGGLAGVGLWGNLGLRLPGIKRSHRGRGFDWRWKHDTQLIFPCVQVGLCIGLARRETCCRRSAPVRR